LTTTDNRTRQDRVVITNVYSDDNRGGSAITAAAIEMARHAVPGCAVTLLAVGSDPDELPQQFRFTGALYPEVEILPAMVRLHEKGPVARLRHYGVSLSLLALPRRAARHGAAVSRLRDANLVIGKGGQAFRGFRIQDLGSLWFTTLPLLVACRMRRRVAVVGVSIGPFSKGRLSRRLAGFVLRRLSLLIVRGHASQVEALAMGVDPRRIRVAPDSVFFLPPPDASARNEMLDRTGLRGQSFAVATLGDLPRNHHLRDQKIQVVRAILARLLEDELVTRAVIVVQTDGKTSDVEISSDCLAACDDPRVQLITDEMSHQELIALYSGAFATIGGRLHSTIFSLLGGTPAFPLAFFNKPHDVFSALGLPELVLDIRGADPSELAERVVVTLAGRPDFRSDLMALSARLRRALTEDVELLSQLPAERAPDAAAV
jgi:polysaccharide pyruvyl transferase WcaK-like protein